MCSAFFALCHILTRFACADAAHLRLVLVCVDLPGRRAEVCRFVLFSYRLYVVIKPSAVSPPAA